MGIADKDRKIDRLVGLVDVQKIEITKLLELLAEALAKPHGIIHASAAAGGGR